MRPKLLFRGSYNAGQAEAEGACDPSVLENATVMAQAVGAAVIRGGFDLVLTGADNLERTVGESAVKTCQELSIRPSDRIRTYLRPSSDGVKPKGFGMTLLRQGGSARLLRNLCIEEASAVIALAGGSGTSDCILRAELARKPIFPIATVGGAASLEWERLKAKGYVNRELGDIDFLNDSSAEPEKLVATIVQECQRLLDGEKPPLSRRVFIVHGHSTGLRNELARFLTKLNFTPIILEELAGEGKTIKEHLLDKVKDVGYAFVLYTPDDVGALASEQPRLAPRARQNVVFEHGLLIGVLGSSRVCAIVQEGREPIERFSDLSGVLYKQINPGSTLESVSLQLVKELNKAGYDVDAALLVRGAD